ncbi:hypothetical protein BJP25_09940 [Actinokineospora bangkokensis]|uniref:HTH luxR-type domain-containing protein n=1 Tax=Actinokineospora bangkokensis TaxID=1193682 RepID=A0A1Q9LQ06_9PSEU|nr:hypothetical protein BJP25_09940 [Actinokineospora bangkokensis]
MTNGAADSQLVELTGDAGIGKTAVLGELVAQARSRHAVVLAGRPLRGTGYGVWADAFDDQHRLVGDVVASWSVLERSELARLFPGLAAHEQVLRPEPGVEVPLPRPAPVGHRLVRELLERLAVPALVVVLDDVHAADPASIDLLGSLLRRPPSAPVMIAVGYRDRQADARLREAIAGRSRQVTVSSARLAPLTEQDTARLLAGRGTASWTQQLHAESEGNPAYLKVLAAERAAFPGGPAGGQLDDLRPGDAPVFFDELECLSPGARAVVEAAAVLGDVFDTALVARMLQRREDGVLASIGELIRHDLVRPVVSGQYFALRHPVVARLIRDTTELSQRVRLHTTADAALQARDAAPAARAPHVEQWARYGDLDAVEVLEAAAASVMGTDPTRAAVWLRTALRVLPQTADLAGRRAEMLVRLAKARGTSGYLRECRDTMHEALRHLPAEPRVPHARAVAFTALVQRLLGAHAETDALVRAEIEALDAPETPACAQLQFELACNALSRGDTAGCQELATQALGVAVQHALNPLRASCLGLLAMARATAGDIAQAREALRGATTLLDAMLDGEFAHSLTAVVWIGWSEVILEQRDDAFRHFDKAVEVATRGESWLVLPHLLVGYVFVLRNRGRLREARTAAEHAVHLAEKSRSPEQLTSAHSMLAWIDVALGETDQALESAMVATDNTRESASGWCEVLAVRMLAEVHLMTRNHEECLAMVAAAGGPDLPAADACTRVAWYEILTRAELLAGRHDAAAAWAERARATAADLDQPGRIALAQLATAQVDATRCPRAAVDDARAALLGLEESGMAVDALRARIVLGTALWHQGEHDEGMRELKTAETAFTQMGAQTLARAARTERRRLAAKTATVRGPRTDTTTGGTATLTGREREVATLVGEGMTNRLIARKLHIAEKTVEMHLSNVFAKLGVTSRSGVAAYMTRQGATT